MIDKMLEALAKEDALKRKDVDKFIDDEKKAEMLQDYLDDKVIEEFRREMALKEKQDLIDMLVTYLKIADMKAELECLQ